MHARPTGDLTVESKLSPSPVRGDPQLVESLIANLVENAARHTPAGTVVRVSNRPDADDSVSKREMSSAMRALSGYVDGIENAPNEALVNALAMMSPYGPAEKQAMLEAPDLKTRAEILIAVTEMDLAKKRTSGDTGLQ